MPASWPAMVGITGRPAGAASRCGQRRRRSARPGRPTPASRSARCRRGRPAPARAARRPASIASRCCAVSARASSHAVTREGMALVPLGWTSSRPNVARCAGEPGLLVGGERGHRVGQHRVAAVLHARRAGVVRLAGEVEPVAPVRPDRAGHADRLRPGRRGRGPARRAARRSSRRRAAGPPSPRRTSSRRASVEGVPRRGRVERGAPSPRSSPRWRAASPGRQGRTGTPPPRRTRRHRSAASA